MSSTLPFDVSSMKGHVCRWTLFLPVIRRLEWCLVLVERTLVFWVALDVRDDDRSASALSARVAV